MPSPPKESVFRSGPPKATLDRFDTQDPRLCTIWSQVRQPLACAEAIISSAPGALSSNTTVQVRSGATRIRRLDTTQMIDSAPRESKARPWRKVPPGKVRRTGLVKPQSADTSYRVVRQAKVSLTKRYLPSGEIRSSFVQFSPSAAIVTLPSCTKRIWPVFSSAVKCSCLPVDALIVIQTRSPSTSTKLVGGIGRPATSVAKGRTSPRRPTSQTPPAFLLRLANKKL